MKLSIVGASGTLGRVLTRQLVSDGVEVELFLRRPDAELEGLTACRVAPDWVFDLEALSKCLAGKDLVINLAARNPNGQARDLEETADFLEVNALAPATLAATCEDVGIPLLHFSTVAVYEVADYRESALLDEAEPLPKLDAPTAIYFEAVADEMREILAGPAEEYRAAFARALGKHNYPAQASVYGLSKLLGERFVVDSLATSCAIRLSDVFGPGHESRGVIVDHLRQMSRSPVSVDLDFRTTAHFIFIDDVVAATTGLARRLSAGEAVPEIVNLVGHCLDAPTLAGALAELAEDRSIKDLRFVLARPPPETFDRRYGSRAIRAVLPEFILTELDTALLRTWDAL